MARRKTSFFEDVMKLGMKLPWWISAVAAVSTYFLLHHYSGIKIPTATGPNDIGGPILASAIKTGSSILQYVIPGLLLFGAILGLIKKLTRKLNFEKVVADKSGDKLDRLTWFQFEDLVHQYFLEKGFEVTETNRGPDGGIDLRLRKNGNSATVQCKHWRSKNVGVSVVREQYGIMTAERANQCFVVTSGGYTKEAQDWAVGKAITLVDGEELRYLLGLVASNDEHLSPIRSVDAATTMSCPNCGSEMVLRTAKRGKNKGSCFWGCSTFPKCRGTRAAV